MSHYSTHPLDQGLARATPTYPVARDGHWPRLAVGQHCYLVAANGLFVMGQGRGFRGAIALAAAAAPTPFGHVEPGVVFDDGRVDARLIHDAATQAVAAAPVEWAGAIVGGEGSGYRLEALTAQSASPAHITYERTGASRDHMIVNIHSHGHARAYFSPHDDASDAHGVHIALVLGRCRAQRTVQAVSRLSINGPFLALDLDAWLSPRYAAEHTA